MVSIAAMILARRSVVAPVDASGAGKIEPRVAGPSKFVQAVLDFPDAACARRAFDRDSLMRRTGSPGSTNNDRSRVSAIATLLFQDDYFRTTRFFERNSRSS
jgi:hypothetical protein